MCDVEEEVAFGRGFIGVHAQTTSPMPSPASNTMTATELLQQSSTLHHCIMEGLFYNVKYGYVQHLQLHSDYI